MRNNTAAKERAIQEANDFLLLKPVYIDTETTGFKPDDEIVDISIIDHNGKILYDSLIKPQIRIPADATNIHHITNNMVSDAPSWKEVWGEINSILSGRVLGVYNAEYDIRMIKQTAEKWGIKWSPPYTKSFCVMELFAEYYGEWDDYHKNYKWQKLEFAGKHFGIKIQNTHRAKDDALLTREVLKAIASLGKEIDKNKICPFCAEIIKEAAIVCKHCKKDLPGFEKKFQKISARDKLSEKLEKTIDFPDDVKPAKNTILKTVSNPIIINDNQKYRNRTYNTIGNYPHFNYKFNFFPKIQLENPDFEDYIYSIETKQLYKKPFFLSLIIENDYENQNNSLGWDITEKDYGRWRKRDEKNNLYLVNLSSLVSKGKLMKPGKVLFDVEYSMEGKRIYDSISSDTIVGFQPDKARILKRNSEYSYGKLLKFNYDCIMHVFDNENLESEPDLINILEFLKEIITIAKYFGDESLNPYEFKKYVENNYPRLFTEYNSLYQSSKEIKKWFQDVKAIVTLFQEVFSGPSVAVDSPLLNCRIHYNVRKFQKVLKEKGFIPPTIKEANDDPIMSLINNRIWYAGQLKEMEWQANHLAKLLKSENKLKKRTCQ